MTTKTTTQTTAVINTTRSVHFTYLFVEA